MSSMQGRRHCEMTDDDTAYNVQVLIDQCTLRHPSVSDIMMVTRISKSCIGTVLLPGTRTVGTLIR